MAAKWIIALAIAYVGYTIFNTQSAKAGTLYILIILLGIAVYNRDAVSTQLAQVATLIRR